MWSQLLDIHPGIVAREKYTLNYCEYHNWDHILDCYYYLEENKVPYDIELDYAVMYHDIVYDKHPEKELRSKEFLLKHFPEREAAGEIIMATADHKIEGRDYRSIHMIKADLHQLAMPVKTVENYVKIMFESKKLYGVNDVDFANGNVKFMTNFANTMYENMMHDTDPFWNCVLQGIEMNIAISTALRKTATNIDLFKNEK